MCFVNDNYDWIARHVDDRRVVSPRPHRCCECGSRIYAWRLARFVEMCEWESEEQWRDECYWETDYDDAVYAPESCTYWICMDCQAVLDAIKRVELAAGCYASESQPIFGELQEAMMYDDDKRYATAALADRPDLADHIKLLSGEDE